jgi:ATP/maltotriose-dependent transcriptional regulator MalT
LGRTNESGLTLRQLEVLRYLAKGLSNRAIAEAIGLAEGTVKIHVAAIFTILGVNRRCDAVQAAQRLGILAGAAE